MFAQMVLKYQFEVSQKLCLISVLLVQRDEIRQSAFSFAFCASYVIRIPEAFQNTIQVLGGVGIIFLIGHRFANCRLHKSNKHRANVEQHVDVEKY